MSIATQLDRIIRAKSNIREAIADKGVLVPSGTKIDSYTDYIYQIVSSEDDGFMPVLKIQTEPNTEVRMVKVGTTFRTTGVADEDGLFIMPIPSPGEWSVTVYEQPLPKNFIVTVSDIYSYDTSDMRDKGWNMAELTDPVDTNMGQRVVTYGGGKFVAAAYGSDIAAYSEDGISWTFTTLPCVGNWSCIAYGNDKFVVLDCNSKNFIWSSDGITWTQATLPVAAMWSAVAFGNGKFVAVASNSTTAAYSTNGTTWTKMTLPRSAAWSSITYGDGKFIAVASNSGSAIYSTTGTSSWTNTNLSSVANWSAITYGDLYGDGKNSRFVAIAKDSNIVAYSKNGTMWETIYLPEQSRWSAVTFANGKFVMITEDYGAAYSDDAINWTIWHNISCNGLSSVVYGNGMFVATTKNLEFAAYCPFDEIIIEKPTDPSGNAA